MNTDIDEGKTQFFKAGANEAIPPRRVVLRGAVALGCGLLLPVSLLGCDSKKGETSGGAAPDTSPAPAAESAAPSAPAKMTQASVQYQFEPKDGQKCSECTYFIADSNACTLVEGEISPDGWCTLWVQKT